MSKLLPGILVLALSAILVLQWVGWPPQPSRAGFKEDPKATGSLDGEDAQTELLDRLRPLEDHGSYDSLTERPLFRPDRRPEPEPEEIPDNLASEEPNLDLAILDLTAVLITPSVVSAWVKDPRQPKLRRLRIGDDFDGWLVQEIAEDRVLLERQGETDTLILRDYTKMPAAAAPKPASQRPSSRPQPPRTPPRADAPRD